MHCLPPLNLHKIKHVQLVWPHDSNLPTERIKLERVFVLNEYSDDPDTSACMVGQHVPPPGEATEQVSLTPTASAAINTKDTAAFNARVMADSFFWNAVQREAAALLPPTLLVASRDAGTALDRTTTVPTGLTFESASVVSRWYTLEDTAGFKTGDAIIIVPGDITSSCGLRELISRGGITFAAASSRSSHVHADAAETDVRTLSVRF